MAIPGTQGTYDLPTGIKLDIEDAIYMISPYELPLQGTMGADNRTAIGEGPCFEKKVEWLDETLLTPKTTLSSAAVTAATTLYLAAGTGINFQTGDALSIDGEVVLVTGYGTTADTLLVSRAYGASSGVQFATGDFVMGIGSALPEGSNPPSARAVDRNDRYNYTQIFGPIGISVTGSEQAVQKYGLTGTEFDHQLGNRIKEDGISIEQALILGIAYAGTGTAGRLMGGMLYYISTNIDSTTTTLTDDTIVAQLQACFEAGGYPDRMLVGAKQKRVISKLDSTVIRYDQTTNVRGQKVDYYESDFGTVSVVLDRWVPVSKAILFERDQATLETLRPLQFQMLAKTGDAENGQIVAEKTLRFRVQQHAAAFTVLT